MVMELKCSGADLAVETNFEGNDRHMLADLKNQLRNTYEITVAHRFSLAMLFIFEGRPLAHYKDYKFSNSNIQKR